MKSLARFLRLGTTLFVIAMTSAKAGGPLAICKQAPVKYPGAGTVNLNYDRGDLGGRTKAQADSIVTAAASLWTNVGTATVTIGRGADLPVDVTATNYTSFAGNFSDGLNPVVYDTDGSIIDTYYGVGQRNNILGFASSGYFTSTCQYVEGRAVINGWLNISDTTVVVVIAHELGHLIGIDHTQLDSTQDIATTNYPIMYPIAYRGIAALHDDDVAAVTALYPDTTLNSVYGQLSGTFVLADGVTPVRGANLWATETTTNKVYSIVSDYLTQNTGYFKLLLPAGNYTMRAEAIQADFVGGSKVGPYAYSSGAPSFQSPLYVGGVPMTLVIFGNSTPSSFAIYPGCIATLRFQIDGSGTIDVDCGVPPGVPTSVSATPRPGAITINFTPPADNGGSFIYSYVVNCTATGRNSIAATGSGSPITVPGLVGGAIYSCSVAATNGAGTGTASALVAATPSSIVPVLMLLLE